MKYGPLKSLMWIKYTFDWDLKTEKFHKVFGNHFSLIWLFCSVLRDWGEQPGAGDRAPGVADHEHEQVDREGEGRRVQRGHAAAEDPRGPQDQDHGDRGEDQVLRPEVRQLHDHRGTPPFPEVWLQTVDDRLYIDRCTILHNSFDGWNQRAEISDDHHLLLVHGCKKGNSKSKN